MHKDNNIVRNGDELISRNGPSVKLLRYVRYGLRTRCMYCLFFKQNDFVFVENCFVPTFLSTHLFKCLNCAIGIFSLTFLSYTSSTKSRTLYKINLIRFEYNISESKHHERYNINLPSFHYECNVRQSECVYSVYLFLFREFACTFLLFRL